MQSVHQQITRYCTESGCPLPPHVSAILAQGEPLKLDCPICYEAIRPDTLVLSQCIHWYCLDCYEMVANRNKICSICRSPFYESTTYIQYPSVYQAALDLLETVELTVGANQRLAIARLLRYIESHPEIFYRNMLLQKIVLQKTNEFKERAWQLGDIELLAACLDTQRVLNTLSTA